MTCKRGFLPLPTPDGIGQKRKRGNKKATTVIARPQAVAISLLAMTAEVYVCGHHGQVSQRSVGRRVVPSPVGSAHAKAP